MIKVQAASDVQIWCDYQEETRQTSADYFLRLRFANFRIFVSSVVDYDDGMDLAMEMVLVMGDGSGDGYSYGFGDSSGDGEGDGNGFGDGDGGLYGLGNGFGDGDFTS